MKVIQAVKLKYIESQLRLNIGLLTCSQVWVLYLAKDIEKASIRWDFIMLREMSESSLVMELLYQMKRSPTGCESSQTVKPIEGEQCFNL